MTHPTRRDFLGAAVAASLLGRVDLPARAAAVAVPRPTDVGVEDVAFDYEDYRYRTPIKFGGTVVDRATILNVTCVVRTRDGRVAKGFGSMPLGNVWSFPSKALPYDATLGAMKALAERIRTITAAHREAAHPIDVNRDLEPDYFKAAEEVARERGLAEPIPRLCSQVVASPFDAAIHDAFGKVHGRSSYQTYGPDFMVQDLSAYLGPEFRGEYASRYVSERPKARMPMYHLVGAVDPIVDADVVKRVGDGLPETLPEWIERDGLTNLKIKLNGEDLAWDVDRVARVDRAAAETQARRGVKSWVYSLDFNEKAPNVAYVLEFIRLLKAKTPDGFGRIQYIEQPTARNLLASQPHALDEASKVLPVVADESLTDYESLLLARDRGYTGAALKACKGQSHAVLLAAAAQKFGMFLCVQDLTCPGASLIHSAGLSAHIPSVRAIEANARQYMPAANKGWEDRFPGIFRVKDGTMETAVLTGPGLGAV
ncbi:mandelate racemase/muconate lactonizing enzyme family protein [Paludisphaera mucosa]|uniref:Mandelate racemase/muconate lactonizing enzyme family protein n=1 Tax=Paludisphaera mucosa TaxID=3030827 RepID=A0ABT6FJD7_9BACT|nr:mandelate racemase/muconate lactonizing enzyme family protein [Paludisphaera mucosa]MDG3007688.1 mandelate racemase/muconate lactonizing enzyme family protein [Paludisphaera mucosa]